MLLYLAIVGVYDLLYNIVTFSLGFGILRTGEKAIYEGSFANHQRDGEGTQAYEWVSLIIYSYSYDVKDITVSKKCLMVSSIIC